MPHIHVHLLPRSAGDFDPMDYIYDELENIDLGKAHRDVDQGAPRRESNEVERKGRKGSVIVDDEQRVARSAAEMKTEAMRLALLFPAEFRGTFID